MGRYKTTGTRTRKRKKGTPTHVARLSLDATPRQERVILVRERACGRVYNACLGEAFRRLERLRPDPGFEKAKAMLKGKARTEAFVALDKKYGFSASALMSYASGLRVSWVRSPVGAEEAQTAGRDAFKATRRWSLGLAGKPKFRQYNKRKVRSVECKDLNGDICPILDNGKLVAIRWGREKIKLASTRKNTRKAEQAEHERTQAAVLTGGLRYCRVVSRLVRGRWCHEAQFVLDGRAPLRHLVGTESVVSIDLGPSLLHVVYDSRTPDMVTKFMQRPERP